MCVIENFPETHLCKLDLCKLGSKRATGFAGFLPSVDYVTDLGVLKESPLRSPPQYPRLEISASNFFFGEGFNSYFVPVVGT